MASAAGRELRHRPGRFIATWIAIAVSVAFVVAAFVVTATQREAVGRQATLALAKADLVATVTSQGDTPQAAILTGARTEQAFAAVDGVAAADHASATPVGLSKGGASVQVQAVSLPRTVVLMPSENPATGAWPADASQVAIDATTARTLGANIDDTVQASVGASGAPATMRVVAITNDASTMAGGVAWVTSAWFMGVSQRDDPSGDYAIALQPDADPTVVSSTLMAAIALPDYDVQVVTIGEAVSAATDQQTGGAGVWTTLLWAFAAIAFVAGALTIASTYTMLMAGRRRQIALSRAIGADSTRIRRSVIVEAALVGIMGSLVGVILGFGVAALVTQLGGAMAWGLTTPWVPVEVAFLLGVLVTVGAAIAPLRSATRAPAVTAFRPVPSADQERRTSRVFGIVAIVLIALGAIGVGISFVLPPNGQALPVALLACGVLAIGVLIAGTWFLPALIRLAGRAFGKSGPVGRMAVANTARNPRRTAMAATAIMLSAGLLVALQVTMASVHDTVVGRVDATQPVAVRITYDNPDHVNPTTMPTNLVESLRAVPGVQNAAILAGLAVRDDQGGAWTALAYTPDAAAVAVDAPQVVATNQAVVNPVSWPESRGDKITLTARGAQTILDVQRSDVAAPGEVLVSQATLPTFGTPSDRVSVWLSVPDRSQASSVASTVRGILGDDLHANVSGAVFDLGSAQDGVTIATELATLLLVVAIVATLVGLGNSLRLSGLERSRESALLRALGMDAGDARRMVLIEALLVGGVAVLAGIVLGFVFGIIGAFVILQGMGTVAGTVIGAGWLWLPVLLVVVVIAAVLASILPGGRVAKAEPMELLAA